LHCQISAEEVKAVVSDNLPKHPFQQFVQINIAI